MTPLPSVSAKRLIKALKKAGFIRMHTKGSHQVFKETNGNGYAVVPYHGDKDLPRGTLTSILKQAGMTPERLLELL